MSINVDHFKKPIDQRSVGTTCVPCTGVSPESGTMIGT